MRIGVCDDEERQLAKMKTYLANYKTPKGETVDFHFYDRAQNLLNDIREMNFDALLLDILMPGLSGMDLSYEVRKENGSIPIVFLTSSPEFAVESYKVKAFDYLLKPVKQDALKEILDRICDKVVRVEDMLKIIDGRGVHAIAYSKLEALEIANHTLNFHLSNGNSFCIGGSLSEYEGKLLEREEFFKCHRSYIINLDHIRAIESDTVITSSGRKLPVSRNLNRQLQEKYIMRLHKVIRI